MSEDSKKAESKKPAISKITGKPKKKRRSPVRYFKDMLAELKKVTWPTRKELITYSGVVLAFVVLVSVMLGILDLGLGSLSRWAYGLGA